VPKRAGRRRTAGKSIRLSVFDRVVGGMKPFLNRYPDRRFAYAVVDDVDLPALLAEAIQKSNQLPGEPVHIVRPSGRKAVIILDSAAPGGGQLLAGISNPSRDVVLAVEELGDVLGYIAPIMKGDPRWLDEALHHMLRDPVFCEIAQREPALACFTSLKFVTATGPDTPRPALIPRVIEYNPPKAA